MKIIKNNYQEHAKNSCRSLSAIEKGGKKKKEMKEKKIFKEGKKKLK